MQVEGCPFHLYNPTTMLKERIAFIGAGNMAESLVAGLLAGKVLPPAQLMVTDIQAERTAYVADHYHLEVGNSNAKAAAWGNVVVYCVEPQVLDQVLKETAPHLQSDALVISVAAGFPIARVANSLPKAVPIIRAMPNTPSSIQVGVTALSLGTGLTDEHVRVAQTIFQSVGQVVTVEEKHMDAVTGLSGSGPAYIYVMIDAMADAGVNMGLPRDVAQRLAAQTLLGSAKMVMETGEHPGQLKDRVASPGGTTIAGIHALEQGGFRATLMNAVEAATLRSRELGQDETP